MSPSYTNALADSPSSVQDDEDARQPLASPELFAWVYMQATLTNEFQLGTWTNMLLWPAATRNSPPLYRSFAKHWGEALAVPGPDRPHQHVSECTAAAVLNVVLRSMTPDAEAGKPNSFLAQQTIAERAHTSDRSVRRVLAWQEASPIPLIGISYPGKTRGHLHKCPRFTWIRFPHEFAAKRDAYRAAVDERRRKSREPARKTASERTHVNHVACISPGGCCLTVDVAAELLPHFQHDGARLRVWANQVAIIWRVRLSQGMKRAEPNREAFWLARLAERANGTPA